MRNRFVIIFFKFYSELTYNGAIYETSFNEKRNLTAGVSPRE